MPPVLRDSGGPEGRQKTSLPASGFPKPSRQDAGVEIACMNYKVRAAGRGVDTNGRHHLTCMYQSYIIMHMRTTLNIDDDLLKEAGELSGIQEKTALVRAGLEALIARESAKRLAALGASERSLRPIPRRRPRSARKAS